MPTWWDKSVTGNASGIKNSIEWMSLKEATEDTSSVQGHDCACTNSYKDALHYSVSCDNWVYTYWSSQYQKIIVKVREVKCLS